MYPKVLTPKRALRLQTAGRRAAWWEDEGGLGESEKRSKRGRPVHPRHSEARTQPEARVRVILGSTLGVSLKLGPGLDL